MGDAIRQIRLETCRRMSICGLAGFFDTGLYPIGYFGFYEMQGEYSLWQQAKHTIIAALELFWLHVPYRETKIVK